MCVFLRILKVFKSNYLNNICKQLLLKIGNISFYIGCLWKKRYSKQYYKTHREQLCRSLFFNKAYCLKLATLLKKRYRHLYIFERFAKFSRAPIQESICEQTLLKIGNFSFLHRCMLKSREQKSSSRQMTKNIAERKTIEAVAVMQIVFRLDVTQSLKFSSAVCKKLAKKFDLLISLAIMKNSNR